MEDVLSIVWILALALGLALVASFVIAGIPAIALKYAAGHLFLRGDRALAWNSVRWSVRVGLIVLAVYIAYIGIALLRPEVNWYVASFSGLARTAVGLSLLAVGAAATDYWKVVRPRSARLSRVAAVGFLLVSNLWVLPGGLLIGYFNRNDLFFPDCVENATGALINTFWQARPEDCFASS
jgi:hypothetical protein